MIDRSGKFVPKYHFADLDVGESMVVVGNWTNIRSAAAAWGRRYGVWLSTHKIADKEIEVTRLDGPKPIRHGARMRPTHRQRQDQVDAIQGELATIKQSLAALVKVTLDLKGRLEE